MRKIALFLLLLYSAPALAYQAQEPRYLNPEHISPELLAPPAAEQTPEWNRQLSMVAAIQSHASRADKAAAKAEQKVSIQMVSKVLKDEFNAERYPKTFKLLEHAMNDTALVTEQAKEYWKTRRPYVAAPHKIKLLVDPVKNNAYPSGHTSISYVLAEVLGLLYPDKRAELRAQANAVARHRIMAGVHYPQDVEGGQKLGAITLGAMTNNSDFQNDLDEARAEIRDAATEHTR